MSTNCGPACDSALGPLPRATRPATSAEFQLAVDRGDIAEARRAAGLIRESAELLTRVLTPAHPDVVAATGSLAAAQFELARLEPSPGAMRSAIGAIAAAHRAAVEAVGPEHPHTLALLADLGTAERELARLEPDPSQGQRPATAAPGFHEPRHRPDEGWTAGASPASRRVRPPAAQTRSPATGPTQVHASGVACMDVIAEVFVYLDLESDDEHRQAIRDHLDECSDCLREYGIEQEVKALVARVVRRDLAPRELTERLRRKIAELAIEVDDVNHARD